MKAHSIAVAALALATGLQVACALDEGEEFDDSFDGEVGEVGSELSVAAGNIFVIGTVVCGTVEPNVASSRSFLRHATDADFCRAVAEPLSRQWAFYELNGAWRIQNRGSNLCMRVRDRSTGNNALVDQDTCTSDESALWRLENIPESTAGAKRLRNVRSQKCLNIAGGDSGTTMIQWTCGNYFNEYFYFDPP